MTRKLTGSTASGKTQPEIRRGQNWRDGYGELLTVTDIGFNRVTFIRNGYEHRVFIHSAALRRNSRLLTEALKMRDNLVNDVRKKADGHWPSVLQRLDIPTNRSEGPCPVCGGDTRYRFDDIEQRGTYHCSLWRWHRAGFGHESQAVQRKGCGGAGGRSNGAAYAGTEASQREASNGYRG